MLMDYLSEGTMVSVLFFYVTVTNIRKKIKERFILHSYKVHGKLAPLWWS